MRLSICTTNYNCSHALARHLRSVYNALAGIDFEYIVVDNRSRDRSLEVLAEWARSHPGMKVLSKRCTMGEGRQLAFRESSGGFIVVLDTDVEYSPLLRRFVDEYLGHYTTFSLQAVFCGIFPRDQWERVGGRRSLNTNEDVDMWVRILKLGTMRWYPVVLGENLKEPEAWGRADYLSKRYTPRERVSRLLRREWDFLKTRPISRIDIGEMIERNTIDLRLDVPVPPWPQRRTRATRIGRIVEFARELRQTMRSL
jgi:glycosyltransferase involved in cell wall biosynthesis